VAIRAKKPEIFSSVIISMTVNVVNGQHQRLAIPNSLEPALCATKWNPCFNHGAPQLEGFSRLRARIAYNQNFLCCRFSWPSVFVALIP
jgi:hypothetical protein